MKQLISCLAFLITAEGTQFFDVLPHSARVATGATATFICATSTGTGIGWNVLAAPASSRKGSVKTRALAGTIQSTYTIENVQSEDNGKLIRCILNKDGEKFAFSTARLTVVEEGKPPNGEAPKVVKQSHPTRADLGAELSIFCRVDGDPVPEVKWMHNGALIDPNTAKNTVPKTEKRGNSVIASLHFVRTTTADSGKYHCLATNQFGQTKSTDIKVTVKTRKIPPRFINKPPPLIEVCPGCPLELICTATGLPRPDVYWKSDTNPKLTSRKYQQSVLTVGKVDHPAVYTCVAESKEFKAIEHRVNIVIRGNSSKPKV